MSKAKGKSREKTGGAANETRTDGKAKRYEVEADRLKKYLKEKPAIAKRDTASWKKLTNKDKKLSSHLSHLSSTYLKTASKCAEHDTLLLSHQNCGSLVQAENALEKTYRVTQDQIKSECGPSIAAKAFSLGLEGGPYKFDYTRNGRFLALAGHWTGDLATIDCQSTQALTQLSVNETTRSVRWLHDQSFFAVAQRQYVYIYDGRQGMEIHQLRAHVEVTQMEFLPYHFLLATVGLPGRLKYHDTSTGSIVAEHRTKLGACRTMCQNPHNSIIHLGHQNGTVTLWSPSVSHAQVKLLAHLGPVTSVAIDPSSSGRIMSTTGMDGQLKVWDLRTWKTLASWTLKKPAKTSAWSQKGLLAIGWGSHVSVYSGVGRNESQQKGAYMSQLFPSQDVEQVQFCPFEDLLGVGHSSGFSHLIIPGSGEANFDSLEADPYESKGRRREREVKNLLDKIPADLIQLNPDMVGTVADPKLKESEELKKLKGVYKPVPFRKLNRAEKLATQGKLGKEEPLGDSDDNVAGSTKPEAAAGKDKYKVQEKKKMRGKNSVSKRLKRKKHKNVITPEIEALKAKMALRKQKRATQTSQQRKSEIAHRESLGALSRFLN